MKLYISIELDETWDEEIKTCNPDFILEDLFEGWEKIGVKEVKLENIKND